MKNMIAPIILLVNILSYGFASESNFSNLLDEIFSPEPKYHIRNDIISKNEVTVICWIETISVIEYKNGTKNVERQFSVIFDSPNDIKNHSVKNMFLDETKRSHNLNFTTNFTSHNFEMKVNKSVVCGSGPVLTKRYTQWNNKKRIQINIGPDTSSEQYNYNYTLGAIPQHIVNAGLNKTELEVANLKIDLLSTSLKNNERVRKQTNSTVNKGTKQIFKVVVNYKIFGCFLNQSNGELANEVLIKEFQEKQEFSLNRKANNAKQNISDQEIKQSWNKLSRLMAKKYYNQYSTINKNDNQ